MRDGWQRVTLGALCHISKGTSPIQKTPPGPYPLIVTGPEPLSSDTFQFEGEAVCVPLVSSTGHGHASLKRVHYARGKFAVANIIAACSPREATVLDARYLFLYLQHFKDAEIVTRMKGTANVSLSITNLASVPVILPPLDDQQRIVDLIAAVDDAVQAAETEAEYSGATRRSFWAAAASCTVRLSDVADVSQGRALPRHLQGTKTGDISWFKIADMTAPGNEFGYTIAETQVSAAVLAAQGGKTTPAGSVAFPRVGAAVATEKKRLLEVDAALDENHIAVTPKMPGTSEFLLAALESVRLGDLARKGAVPSINMSLIRSLDIRWLPEQADSGPVDLMLSASRASERCARATAKALRTLRSDLLTVLLTGEHAIPSSYDALVGGKAA